LTPATMKIERHRTRQVRVRSVPVGGGAPISVQTMTKTDTRDAAATIEQIRGVSMLGCDIVRVAVPDAAAVEALGVIRRETDVPLVADIHFDHRLAVAAVEAGADGLRINPGNIGGVRKVGEVVAAARERRVPIRIGVNSGSLEEDLREKHGGSTPAALVESALRNVRLVEDMGYRELKVSAKATDVARTVQTYRLLAAATDCPLHLGVTEAGTFMAGTVRSSAALGILLAEGIGDTIRISLTDTPGREVGVGLELLRAFGLRAPGPRVIACPTCGRVQVDVRGLADALERELAAVAAEYPGRPMPVVAVMGCVVNGPGEAREADIAVAGGKGSFALYVGGRRVGSHSEDAVLEVVTRKVKDWMAESGTGRDVAGS